MQSEVMDADVCVIDVNLLSCLEEKGMQKKGQDCQPTMMYFRTIISCNSSSA